MVIVRFQTCIIKASVDMLAADTYNDTYLKTEIDTLFEDVDLSSYYTTTGIDSTYTTSIQLYTGFYSKAKTNPLLEEYYTNTETQANYYDKTATGSLLVNYTGSENIDITDNQISLRNISIKSE